MAKANIHCECTETGRLVPGWDSMYDPVTERPYVSHAPGECKCTNDLRLYREAGTTRVRFLCSCCCMGEEEVTQ